MTALATASEGVLTEAALTARGQARTAFYSELQEVLARQSARLNKVPTPVEMSIIDRAALALQRRAVSKAWKLAVKQFMQQAAGNGMRLLDAAADLIEPGFVTQAEGA